MNAITRTTEEHTAHLQKLQQLVLAMPMARTLGLKFNQLAPGTVELEIPMLEAFTFRPGQLQATAVFALADFAAVAAAGTLLPPGWLNATVDATLKLIAPAQGALLRARGRVVSAGRLLTVCAADVFTVSPAGEEALCATLLGTARNIDHTQRAP
ncbi:MAG: PaaI family thioesterase [Polaromonas sp.]|nr:PaaI family thioesterase [Polaromonas sp.]